MIVRLRVVNAEAQRHVEEKVRPRRRHPRARKVVADLKEPFVPARREARAARHVTNGSDARGRPQGGQGARAEMPWVGAEASADGERGRALSRAVTHVPKVKSAPLSTEPVRPSSLVA